MYHLVDNVSLDFITLAIVFVCGEKLDDLRPDLPPRTILSFKLEPVEMEMPNLAAALV